VEMTVLIGQRKYEAEIYYEHAKVVKVGKHQGDVGCTTPSIRQIIMNSAKFTTVFKCNNSSTSQQQSAAKKILIPSSKRRLTSSWRMFISPQTDHIQ
jgi:hypothetical protein